MSFIGVLTTIFVVLKIVGVISWSWLWVLSPLWLPFLALFTFALICFAMAGIGASLEWFTNSILDLVEKKRGSGS